MKYGGYTLAIILGWGGAWLLGWPYRDVAIATFILIGFAFVEGFAHMLDDMLSVLRQIEQHLNRQ